MRRTPTPQERGFSERDIARLSARLRTAETPRQYQRIQAVMLIAEGYSVAEAAEIVDLSPPCVYRWLAAYLKHPQYCMFDDAGRSGRPAIDMQISATTLLDLLRDSPLKHGYVSTGWTVSLLREHLREHYNVEIGADALRQRLHRLGLRWKRPRYVFTPAEPHLAQKKGGSYDV